MITENLSTLKIHKLTQAQYDRELAAGNIDVNALYLTPDEAIDLSNYATIDHSHTWEQLEEKPFGEKIVGLTELYPTTTLNVTMDSNDFFWTVVRGLNSSVFDNYQNIRIVFDGINYDFSEKRPYYGNDYFYNVENTDNGLPFCIKKNLDLDTFEWGDVNLFTRTQGEHTLAVYAIESAIVTIDEKYLPNSIARLEATITLWYEGSGSSGDMFATDQIYGAASSLYNLVGKDIIVTFNGEEYNTSVSMSGDRVTASFGDGYQLYEIITEMVTVLQLKTTNESYDITVEVVESKLPISKGGTGATTAAGALTNFGLTSTSTSNAEIKVNSITIGSGKLTYDADSEAIRITFDL